MLYTDEIKESKTSQREKIFGSEQVLNNAGGYVYKLEDKIQRLIRFLILGSDSNFYESRKKVTMDNAEFILKLVKDNTISMQVIDKIVEISVSGRAPKNDAAIFALALAASYGDENTRKYALSKVNSVCRIGTHLFSFVSEIQNMRGWGRSLRKGISNWYLDKDEAKLGYQLLKYKNRNGWTHKDVMNLAHPIPKQQYQKDIFKTLFKGFDEYPNKDQYYVGANFSDIVETDEKKAASLIREYSLPREVVPTRMLNNPNIWDALVDGNMGMTAMLRNIAKMTVTGYIAPFSEGTKKVISQLSDVERIRKSRIHPINILAALLIYRSGLGFKGNNTWDPVSEVVDCLESMFYASFGNVNPTNKRNLVSLDVSGSMGCYNVSGYEFMTAAEASAAMALITVKTEPFVELRIFSDKFINPKITKNTSIWDAINIVKRFTFGSTDCSLPMLWAKNNKVPIDVFSIWTDNETWYGERHPSTVLKEYRRKMDIDSKLIVCATVASHFTIADPNDKGMLDISGFDSSVPQIISEFSKGGI